MFTLDIKICTVAVQNLQISVQNCVCAAVYLDIPKLLATVAIATPIFESTPPILIVLSETTSPVDLISNDFSANTR